MALRINEATVYEPDAALRVGAALDDDATLYEDPVIVVEVASPSTQSLDAGTKLADYFMLPSLRHYLIVRPLKPSLILHSRLADGMIQTSFAASGPFVLAPPGITLEIESLLLSAFARYLLEQRLKRSQCTPFVGGLQPTASRHRARHGGLKPTLRRPLDKIGLMEAIY